MEGKEKIIFRRRHGRDQEKKIVKTEGKEKVRRRTKRILRNCRS
jgi:hypothetical protein